MRSMLASCERSTATRIALAISWIYVGGDSSPAMIMQASPELITRRSISSRAVDERESKYSISSRAIMSRWLVVLLRRLFKGSLDPYEQGRHLVRCHPDEGRISSFYVDVERPTRFLASSE